MRLHPWAVAGLAGAIASSIPFATSHELHLPYLPSIGQDDHLDSYLSLKWSIINGSLYANEDRVFPPSMSMQLHAPRREGPSKMLVDQNEVEFSYSLEARPLSTEENGGTSRIVRVRVDLLSPEGSPVTPNTVVLDLLTKPDDSQHITRIRVEPTKVRHAGHSHGGRVWLMKFWETRVAALFKTPETKQASSLSISGSKQLAAASKAKAIAETGSDSAAESQPGYILSAYWSPTYSRPSHRQSSHPNDGTFVRLVRPVILPALLGAAAGLVACLIGFVVGHLVMSVSVRLGLRKKRKQSRRSRAISVEDGTVSGKSQFVPKTFVTKG